MRPTSLCRRSALTSRRQTVLGCAAVLLVAISVCRAQSPTVLASEIPAQPLSQALTAFAAQTALQLIYVSDLARGRVSQSVPAGLPVREALTRMLEGTGLGFDFLNPRTIRLLRLEAVSVAPPAASAPLSESPVVRLAIPPETLEDILVTATKREELLSTVPLSANVLTAEAMEASGVKSVNEVGELTPGVEFDFSPQWGAGILTNVAIRGINSQVGTATTGIYIDDAAVQARNANFGNPYLVTFDLARVEVLRGPQGTLFGAGAEGGAIRFITAEPSLTTFGGYYRTEISETDHGSASFETGAAVGGPVVAGRLGLRASVWYRNDGGYVDRVNPFTGATLDDNANQSSWRAMRVSAAMAATDSVRITPSLAYQSVHVHDTPSFYTYLSNPGDGVLRNGKLLRQPAADSFVIASVKIITSFTASTLTAVTSYFDRTGTATVDSTNVAGAVFFGGFGNPLGSAYPASYANAIPTLLGLHQIALSQEARLTSTDTKAPLTWLLGEFFSRARQDDTRSTHQIATPDNPGLFYDDHNIDTQFASFGEVRAKLSSGWSITLGARISRTTSDFTERAGGFAYVGVPSLSHAVATDTPVTPRFGVSYENEHHNLLYATVAKGFRVGGINVGVPAQCSAATLPTYSSDSVWSYEMGAKDTLFDDHLRLYTSLFHIRWNNIQESVAFRSCGFGYTANVGTATSSGLDVAAEGVLGDRIRLGLALGFVDAHYTKTVTAVGEVIAYAGTVVGGVPSVPSPWIATAWVQYQFPLCPDVAGYARVENTVHSHNPGPFSESDPGAVGYDPTLRADPATNKVNLQVGLAWTRFDIKLFVNNALNSQPTLQRSPDAPGSTLNYAYTFRPRTAGLTGLWRF
jgi:iron complex outermembrane recepter protein